MRIHFIAIGGAVMHNMAIALQSLRHTVTGSDDEIVDPSASNLAKHGLLPKQMGWYESNITKDIDAIVLGMHARKDNPELLKAQELGLNIYSYPEYIALHSKDKTRVVIGGSHGKTTITSMIMHVLRFNNIAFDYLVGAKLEGFDTMVQLTDAPIIILEGDEYLASPIDLRPKFHIYHANIALLTGIAWDHINVFPTFENYLQQFLDFVPTLAPNAALVYYENDKNVQKVADVAKNRDCTTLPYGNNLKYSIDKGQTILHTDTGDYNINIFGEHNLQNIQGAKLVCNQLKLSDVDFYTAIQSFNGAARRLELISKSKHIAVYKDFAHSPSKLQATTAAMKAQYPKRKLVACMELHTFSSLNKNFLDQYAGTMDAADKAFVYFNPHTIEHKKLSPISREEVKAAFNKPGLKVFTDSRAMLDELFALDWTDTNLLMMSSGNFDGIDYPSLGYSITGVEN